MGTSRLSYEVHSIRSVITLSDSLINKITGLAEMRQEPLVAVITDLCSGISPIQKDEAVKGAFETEATIAPFIDALPKKAREAAQAYAANLFEVIRSTGEYWTYGEMNAAFNEYGNGRALRAIFQLGPVLKVFANIVYLKEEGQRLVPLCLGDVLDDNLIDNMEKEYQLYKKYGFGEDGDALMFYVPAGNKFIKVPHSLLKNYKSR